MTYACEIKRNEVHRAHTRKVIALIVSRMLVTEDKAIELLSNATIDNPVRIEGYEYWTEK